MPKPSLVLGLAHEAYLPVTLDLTVPEVSKRLTAFGDMPPVFATAFLVAFFETTCIECLRGHLEEGEHTVGTHVNVSHVAATPVGMRVRAKVELVGIERRKLYFPRQRGRRNGAHRRGHTPARGYQCRQLS